jgi:amidase
MAFDKNEIIFLSASEIAEGISKRQFTSYEVVSAFFEQIQKYNPTYNAICTTNKEQALLQAQKADVAILNGEKTGLLHGSISRKIIHAGIYYNLLNTIFSVSPFL